MNQIWKAFADQVNRDLGRREFNPNLTMGEYAALPAHEKREWDRQLKNYWTEGHPDFWETKQPEKRGFNDEVETTKRQFSGYDSEDWGS